MKLKLLLTAALAATAFAGCATYEQPGASGPGGYYQGRPQVRYIGGYNYGSPYGGYYGGGYYGSPYGFGYPYYGYYGPSYPYYRPHHPPPRPPHGGHDDNNRPPPPGSGPGGNRPAPWRDPTRGAWRDAGEQPMVPGQPSQQNQQRPYQRPPRMTRPPANSSNPAIPRTNNGPQSMPRSTMPRSSVPRSSSAPARSYSPPPRMQQRSGGKVQTLED